MKRKTKLWIAAILGLLIIVGALVGVKAGQIVAMIKAGKSFVPPPESVASATVENLDWQASRSAIGTLVAVRGVTLGSELAGLVREISFESGGPVKRGAVLVKLDTSTEEAQLQASLAEAALAKVNLDRARNLRKAGSNTPADLDAAEARAKQADAAVATLRTTIAKKTIRAPFDGRIAIRQVELGQVLASGAPIASLQSVTPIHVDFWLPQQALADVKVGQQVKLRTDAFPQDGWNGVVTVINPEVDVATRNVRFRATLDNPDGRLRPGMFANVELLSSDLHQVLVVPATAVLYAPYGDSVYVLEEQKDAPQKDAPQKDAPQKDVSKTRTVVRQRFVRLGERRGDFVAVLSGLSAGESVVSSGAFKLRNGMAVTVNNGLAPSAEIAPRPAE